MNLKDKVLKLEGEMSALKFIASELVRRNEQLAKEVANLSLICNELFQVNKTIATLLDSTNKLAQSNKLRLDLDDALNDFLTEN